MYSQPMRMMRKMMAWFFGRSIMGFHMTSCREVITLLSDYLDDDLPHEEMRNINMHLKACVDCRNYMNTYRETVRILGEIPDEPIPPAFEAHLEVLLQKRLRGE